MPELAELLTNSNRTNQEDAQLRERIRALEALLSNMQKLLNKSTTGIDADTVDGHHGTSLGSGYLFVLPSQNPPDYAFEVSNCTPDAVLDCDSTTLGELADVVGTIINKLIDLNIFYVPK